MAQKPTNQGWPQASDFAVESALPMVGSLTREDGQTVFNLIDAELEKLFADRNTLLAGGGTLSWSGTALTTSSSLLIHLNATNGDTPVVKTLTDSSFTLDTDGDMLYAVLDNRTGNSNLTIAGGGVVHDSLNLPDPTSADQDVVLIAKRIGTSLYFRNGLVLKSGEAGELSRVSTLTYSDSSATISSNSIAVSADKTVYQITAAGTLNTITGGADGRVIVLQNASTGNVILTNDNGTTDNAIITGSGSNITLASGASVELRFESAALGSFNDNKWYVIGGVGSGTGSGSGEINSVLNPSAATDTTGWAAATNHTVTKDEANSPLSPVISTSLAMTGTAATTESNTSGVSYAITMPSGLRSKKLKLEFYFTSPTSTNGTWAVSVYDGSTRIPLTTDVAGASLIPVNLTGKYTTYFDASSSSSYSVRFTHTAVAASNTLYVNNVIVGPGIQPQGAIVSGWNTYTPSGAWSTNTSYFGRWKRDGSDIILNLAISLSGAPSGTLSTSAAQMLNGLGLTLDTTAFPNYGTTGGAGLNFTWHIGDFDYIDNGVANYMGQIMYDANAGTARWMTSAVPTASITPTSPFTWGSGDTLAAIIRLPIAEWAGSGTVNLAQNDVQYLHNTSTSTSASDTTAFGYGPAGSLIQSISSSGNWVERTVQSQTPVQPGTQPIVEVSPDGVQWFDSEDLLPAIESGSAKYGISVRPDNTSPGTSNLTKIIVKFGGNGATGTEAWSATPTGFTNAYSAWRWRVRFGEAGNAVGFGLATSTQSGLVGTGAQSFAGVKKFEGGLAEIGVDKGTTGSTVTLTDSDRRTVRIQPSASITVTLPTTSIKSQEVWTIYNDSAANSQFLLNIQSSGANAVCTIARGYAKLIALQDAPTTAAHWRILDLDDYQDVVVSGSGVTYTVSAGTGSDSNIALRMARRMNSVAAYIGRPQINQGVNTTFTISSSSGAIPSRFRPSGAGITTAARGKNNGGNLTTPIVVEITTTGTVTLYRLWDNSGFTNTGLAGMEADVGISWTINNLALT